jgi:hypothetical protein
VSTYIGATAYDGTTAATSHTFARDFSTGSNKRAFLLVKSDNTGNNATAVTVGGNAASIIANDASGNLRVYSIGGVGNGSQDVVITFATVNTCKVVCAQYDNCGTLGTAVVDPSNTQTPSVTVTSATGETVIGGGIAIYGTLAITPGAGQTERYDTPTNGTNFWVSDEAGAASVAHSYSMNDFAFNAQLIWGVSAQTAGGGTAPSITVQPASQSVTAPATATFTVTATGTGTLTYQWQRQPAAGGGYTDISGATSSSYTTPATTVSGGSASNNDTYRVVVTGDTSPPATSSAATLTVIPGTPPAFGRYRRVGPSR